MSMFPSCLKLNMQSVIVSKILFIYFYTMTTFNITCTEVVQILKIKE